MTKDIFVRLIRTSILITALLVAIGFTIPACSAPMSPEQLDAYKTAINDTKQRADTYSADANQKLQEADDALLESPEDPDLLKERAKYAEAVKTAAKMKQAAEVAEQLLANSVNPDGTANIAGSMATAATLVPPPWNGLLLVGGPLVALAVGELRRRRDLGNIVDALEAAKSKDAELVGALKRNKGTILGVMNDNVYNFIEKRLEK
jgi:uncharacterized membrane protein